MLREYALEPLRRAMRVAGARVLAVASARDAAGLEGTTICFDAAWIELESLAGLDLGALGREVSRVLRPGARLVCVVPGARPLPRLVRRALLAEGEAPAGGASLASWRRAFEPAFAWRKPRAFGVLVPPGGDWGRLQPLLIASLAALEHAVGAWPLVRALGERVVHEGVRR